MTISVFSDELAQVRTKKREFLSQIERIVPWKINPANSYYFSIKWLTADKAGRCVKHLPAFIAYARISLISVCCPPAVKAAVFPSWVSL